MKSRYKILQQDNGLYFVTLTVLLKIPIFTNSTYMNIIIENLKFYRKNQELKIFSYVIMDNHVHLILSHPENLTKVLQNFKSYSAKKLISSLKNDSRDWILSLMNNFKSKYKKGSIYQFWQEGNHPKKIVNIEMFNQKVEYIHHNPVRRGLVANAQDWIYSSARCYENLNFISDQHESELTSSHHNDQLCKLKVDKIDDYNVSKLGLGNE